MRKGFAIFLLIVLGCPLLGTGALLLHRREEIREMMKARILADVDCSELVRLIFSKKDSQTKLDWEHSLEFEYLGEMYDVAKSEAQADSIIYWCILDKAETQINRQLESLVALTSSTDQQRQNSLHNFLAFLKSLFYEMPEEPKTFAVTLHRARCFYLSVESVFLTNPPVPPPEV